MARTSVHRGTGNQPDHVTRQEQKQRTRRALLDAAIALLENENLSSLSLREVTRAVGIAPAAFYRHFRDMDDLGVALVEESLGDLLPLIRQARQDRDNPDDSIRRSVDLLVAYVESHKGPFRIIAREKFGGVAPVRQVINDKLRQATDELADDLARLPAYAGWRRDDITMVADMYVNHIVQLASTLLDVPADQPDEARRIIALARRQLHLIIVGRRHWLAEPPPD
jgi:AcrR family transcriptional regulator